MMIIIRCGCLLGNDGMLLELCLVVGFTGFIVIYESYIYIYICHMSFCCKQHFGMIRKSSEQLISEYDLGKMLPQFMVWTTQGSAALAHPRCIYFYIHILCICDYIDYIYICIMYILIHTFSSPKPEVSLMSYQIYVFYLFKSWTSQSTRRSCVFPWSLKEIVTFFFVHPKIFNMVEIWISVYIMHLFITRRSYARTFLGH